MAVVKDASRLKAKALRARAYAPSAAISRCSTMLHDTALLHWQPCHHNIERVEEAGLRIRQKGRTHEGVGVPQRQAAFANGLRCEIAQRVEIQQQVAASDDAITERELPCAGEHQQREDENGQ